MSKSCLYKVYDDFENIVCDDKEFGIKYWDSEEYTSIKWFKTENELIEEFGRVAEIKKEKAKRILETIDKDLEEAKLELRARFKLYREKHSIKN